MEGYPVEPKASGTPDLFASMAPCLYVPWRWVHRGRPPLRDEADDALCRLLIVRRGYQGEESFRKGYLRVDGPTEANYNV